MKTPNMAVCCTRKSEKKILRRSLIAFQLADHAHRRKQPGEHHQPQTQPVHAHVVIDGGVLNPRAVDLKLKAALRLQQNARADAA